VAASASLLPRGGQCAIGEAGGCPRCNWLVVVEGRRPATGRARDFQEPWRQYGATEADVSATLRETASQPQCRGNACYAETDAQDLDLAKRAKNLGLSIELTLLFDGGSSSSVPAAWANDTLGAQLQSDLYTYVKAEILSYRQAGTMPDLVSIGNEVDTGFLGSLGSPTGAAFGGFAALQIQAIQAVNDAAADPSLGPAIPAPLTCIHITPAWDLTQFFTLANHNSIPYDAICQSYYPHLSWSLDRSRRPPRPIPTTNRSSKRCW
jgi:arabinogalactan endo-1,4-beta-galactosidase